MKALVRYGDQELGYEDAPDPEPAAGEVVLGARAVELLADRDLGLSRLTAAPPAGGAPAFADLAERPAACHKVLLTR